MQKSEPIRKTEKFVHMTIKKCQDCLVAPVCEGKKEIDSQIKETELYDFMFGIRKWDESQKLFRKGLLEAWINMGISLVYKNIADIQYKEYPKPVSPVFLEIIYEMIQILIYIVNSLSWDDGEINNTDLEILKQKVNSLQRYFDSMPRSIS